MAQAAIADLVRKMSPVRYTVDEAAQKVGVSRDTLARWRKKGVYLPSDYRDFGQLKVWLYTDDDLTAMKRMKAKRDRPST